MHVREYILKQVRKTVYFEEHRKLPHALLAKTWSKIA